MDDNFMLWILILSSPEQQYNCAKMNSVEQDSHILWPQKSTSHTSDSECNSPGRKRAYRFHNPTQSDLPDRITYVTPQGRAFRSRLDDLCRSRCSWKPLNDCDAKELIRLLDVNPTETNVREMKRRFRGVWKRYVQTVSIKQEFRTAMYIDHCWLIYYLC